VLAFYRERDNLERQGKRSVAEDVVDAPEDIGCLMTCGFKSHHFSWI
jgi:hypothetical protein